MPGTGPGYTDLLASEVATPGRGGAEIARAVIDGDISALWLFQTDPVRDRPDRPLWDEALRRAGLVVAHASVLTEGLEEHANVIFPAESYAEKEGTVVHPDGRLQRLRTAIAHPGSVRAGWSVIAEIARRAGLDTGVLTSPMAFAQLVQAVPFYRGITLEAIAGRGVRWPELDVASELPAPSTPRPARRRPLREDRPGEVAAARGGRWQRCRVFERIAAARDLPVDLGRARGRDLTRAPLHRRPAAGRALTRGRAAARRP